ncbi:FAD-dependent oxidoreductase [Nocardia brasiliensis]
MDEFDVVIVGAGPVGLLLACELSLAHCSVLVLEREPNPHSNLPPRTGSAPPDSCESGSTPNVFRRCNDDHPALG